MCPVPHSDDTSSEGSDQQDRTGRNRSTPCTECPWKKESPLGKFDVAKYVELASTATQGLAGVFACHMSAEGGEIACAGYLAVTGPTSLTVRLMAMAGVIDLEAVEAAVARGEYPEKYGSYGELAVANGVPAHTGALADPDLWTGRGPLSDPDGRMPLRDTNS